MNVIKKSAKTRNYKTMQKRLFMKIYVNNNDAIIELFYKKIIDCKQCFYNSFFDLACLLLKRRKYDCSFVLDEVIFANLPYVPHDSYSGLLRLILKYYDYDKDYVNQIIQKSAFIQHCLLRAKPMKQLNASFSHDLFFYLCV